jgi:hypothetical protein
VLERKGVVGYGQRYHVTGTAHTPHTSQWCGESHTLQETTDPGSHCAEPLPVCGDSNKEGDAGFPRVAKEHDMPAAAPCPAGIYLSTPPRIHLVGRKPLALAP